MIKINIKAYANCDHAFVVWKPEKEVPNCLGFALIRMRDGKKQGEIVETFVGPANGPKVPPGTSRPSTQWPIQKFMWSDYLAQPGDTIRYRVIPMIGPDFDHLRRDDSLASPLSNAVSLDPLTKNPIQPYFNRGVVSTQWVARQLQAAKGKSLRTLVQSPSNVRRFLGGMLLQDFLGMLEQHRKAGAHMYACLFELNDAEVLEAILKFGQKAHVILADGTHAAPKPKKGQPKPPKKQKGTVKIYDENAIARKELRKGHIELHDRMVTGGHFSHHKFIVFTDPKHTTQATEVWTGSTNLTYGGLCTQANNGILIKDETIADRFMQQWRELVKDASGYPKSLPVLDAKPVQSNLNGAKVTLWLSPNPKIGPGKTKDGDHADLSQARSLIQGAKEGILFLVFNPGSLGTLLNTVLELLNSPKSKNLYIHGVANQDPTVGKDHSPLIFVHRNEKEKAPAPAEQNIVLPAAINVSASLSKKDKAAADALNKWVRKVEDYWQTEPSGLGMVRVTQQSCARGSVWQAPGHYYGIS